MTATAVIKSHKFFKPFDYIDSHCQFSEKSGRGISVLDSRWMFTSCSLYILISKCISKVQHWKMFTFAMVSFLCQYMKHSGEKVSFHWSVLLKLIILRGIIFLNCKLPKTISTVFESTESFCGNVISPSDFFLVLFSCFFLFPLFSTQFYLFLHPTDTCWLTEIYLISQSFIIKKLQIDSSLATGLLHN